MKNIIFLLCLAAFTINAQAQTFPAKSVPTYVPAARGGANAGGTYQAFGTQTGQIYTIVTGTVTPMPASRAADTLVSPATGVAGYATDSGYVGFSFTSQVNRLYDFIVTTISGTLAGTAILQGSKDGLIWYNITGNTTYCASCTGASASLSGAGTTHYQWYVPKDADNYQYHQVRAITSGTNTATFSATQTTSY